MGEGAPHRVCVVAGPADTGGASRALGLSDTAHDSDDVRIPAWTPPLFFDSAAGLPPKPATVTWLTAAMETAWADPLGRHAPAARSRAVLDQSRARFAAALGCQPHEIWFATSAEQALSRAVQAVCAAAPADLHVLTSPVERLSLLQTLDVVAEDRPVTQLPVDSWGRVDPEASPLALPAAAVLVQAANREIGTRQPLTAVAQSRAGRATLVVDATAVRCPGDVPGDWDVLVLDPMMWGGPDGIAVMACRSGVPWRARRPATAQQRFLGRSSPALAATAAMSLPVREDEQEEARLAALVERLAARLARDVPHVVRHGHPTERLSYLLAVSLLYVNAEQLVDDLTVRGFAVHSGSACSSEINRPSHVLSAIGALTGGNLRISLPPGCPQREVDALADSVAALVAQQRRDVGLA